jgi:hypothetical protein
MTQLHTSDISAVNIESAETHALNELYTKRFIQLKEGVLIPTSSILEVHIVAEPKPYYSDITKEIAEAAK